MKNKCKRCGKAIRGKPKIRTKKAKRGKKIISIIEYFDEKCFDIISKGNLDGRRIKEEVYENGDEKKT